MKATGIVRRIGEGTVHRKVNTKNRRLRCVDGGSAIYAFSL